MKKTETSSFGVGKKESHDPSAFYKRSICDGVFAKPTPKKEMLKVSVPPPGDWANKIYCAPSTTMKDVPHSSGALAFTSPP